MENKTVVELWPEGIAGLRYGYTVVGVSGLIFYLLSCVVARLSPTLSRQSAWRWKNICVSFVHSVLSSCWACLCLYVKPEMAEDMISTFDTLSHTLIAVSLGYFLYDILDMLVYQRTRQSYELMIHHVVILFCFSIALVTQMYVGYAVVSLLVEINSIFLHIRQLLQILGVGKENGFYRFNSVINLGTFVLCRIIVIGWMSRWLLVNKDAIPLVFYSVGSIGLAIMTVMNIILFYRLLRSDFLRKNKDSCKKEN